MFNYPGEYFQLPWAVFSITLGNVLSCRWEYFQLPWGVFSTTLPSIFSYPGEHVQLPWGNILNYPGWLGWREGEAVEALKHYSTLLPKIAENTPQSS